MIRRIAPFALVAALVACAPASPAASVVPADPSGSSSPSDAPSPTSSQLATLASPTGLEVPSPGAGLRPDTIAEVVTDDLVVRSLPEISDDSIIHPTYLQRDQLLFVLGQPVVADGYQWYHVVPFDRCPSCSDTPRAELPLIGWVAAQAPDGETWIAPLAEECTDPQSYPSWRPGFIALACLGDREVVVEGMLAACAGVVPGFVTPTWLAEAGCELSPWGFDPAEGGGIGPGNMGFAVAPDATGALPSDIGSIRITGHLDDPDAASCVESVQTGESPTPPELVVLRCRAKLVATHMESLDESQVP